MPLKLELLLVAFPATEQHLRWNEGLANPSLAPFHKCMTIESGNCVGLSPVSIMCFTSVSPVLNAGDFEKRTIVHNREETCLLVLSIVSTPFHNVDINTFTSY
ncbi:hypothetical protein B0H13DRAFT_1855838 [Mycena leptocephala]|nr:hypothetical protein B0H13DRAFT_1855838 [Mycena leptocephala]